MKSETRFRDGVHAFLPPITKFHRQSMNSAATTFNGTPDMYYDGDVKDLWVEYKWLDHVPKNGIIIGAYTELQLRWMKRRYAAGKNVWGIIGVPGGGVIQDTPQEWEHGTSIAYTMTRKEIARLILENCNGK